MSRALSLFAEFYFLQILADLSDSHGRVLEHFTLIYFFIQNLGKDHLKGHRNTRLFQVSLEHVSLFFPFCGFVHALNIAGSTSFIYSYYSGSGSGGGGGGGGGCSTLGGSGCF